MIKLGRAILRLSKINKNKSLNQELNLPSLSLCTCYGGDLVLALFLRRVVLVGAIVNFTINVMEQN